MGAAEKKGEVVAYGGVTARIKPRSNGFYAITWREAKKGRSTTAVTLEGARKMARAKVRELAGKAGSRMVSILEAEALDGLKEVCGARSLPAVVEQLKDLVSRVGGFQHVVRACEGYLKAGHGKLVPATAATAVTGFLQPFKTGLYKRGLQKELNAFTASFANVGIADVDEAMLQGWISRENEDGSEPGWRYFNNRLATWKTFLNWCRRQRMLVRDEDHAAELVKPMRKLDSVPEIWSVELAERILEVVREELNESLTYLVTGCWMGLRPFEMGRVVPSKWDWERSYLCVDADVAQKVMQQRFVPIPPNVRELLYERLTAEQRRWGAGQGSRVAKHIVRSDDQVFISRLLRAKGLIERWPQDVMRHSYISYRLAQGHGRGQVAEWAGNSEGEIRRSYRRPLRAEDGDRWFEIGMTKPE